MSELKSAAPTAHARSRANPDARALARAVCRGVKLRHPSTSATGGGRYISTGGRYIRIAFAVVVMVLAGVLLAEGKETTPAPTPAPAPASTSAPAPTSSLSPAPTLAPPPDGISAFSDMQAYEAVREGNRRLLAGDSASALPAYERARELEPGAQEIDFVEGLAHYALGDYERARGSFEDAATSKRDSLVDDAIYSIGTTYHAEALANSENPEQAIGQLENAMRRYQTVLTNQPDHKAARNANYKAASMWRTLKQHLEQQQQKQEQQNQDGDSDNDEQKPQESEKPGDEKQDQQDQQPSESEESQDEQQQSQTQESDEQQDQQQQKSQAEQQEQESKEQAERKLRELMQALRDREKRRPDQVQPVQVAPASRDW